MKKAASRALAAAALAVAMAIPASAQPGSDAPVAVGTLTCDVSAGFGLIVGSKRSVNCTFAPTLPGQVEFYSGTITKAGVDIGATSRGVMVWLVYAPTNRPAGALGGVYGGAAAEATFAVGLGANVLVGGSNRTVALQPVSIQGQVGLNLAVGVAELELRFMR